MSGPDNLIPYQFKRGAPGGPGRPMSLIRSIRAHTDDGDEIVAFMLAIMRGDVDVIYPARASEKKVRLRGLQRGKGANVAEALSELLKPSRPRHLRLADRMAAAAWLANRGWGRAPMVIKMEEGGKLPFDAGRLTREEQDELRRLLVKGQPGSPAPALLPPRIDTHRATVVRS